MSVQWWCGTFNEWSNRPPWNWREDTEDTCALCMEPISRNGCGFKGGTA